MPTIAPLLSELPALCADCEGSDEREDVLAIVGLDVMADVEMVGEGTSVEAELPLETSVVSASEDVENASVERAVLGRKVGELVGTGESMVNGRDPDGTGMV